MRTLTPSEARVIALLLAARPDRERDRLRTVDVPRSTYHAVRRRAYEEGWLKDRYVPHPVPLGRPFVSFLVARPYADRAEALANAIAQDTGAVVLWTGAQVALAVFYHADAKAPKHLLAKIEGARLAPAPVVATARTQGPTVPVYFDFEGLWCHVAGFDGTLAYPHGLGGGMEADDGGAADSPAPSLSAHQRWAVAELVNRPFTATDQGRGGHLVGPLGLPFSQRRLLQRGWVVHRTILDPARLPPFQGRAADQVVLVTGAPKREAQPASLFATLGHDCRVFPFLFATASDRWLLGAMGSTAPPSTGTPPRRPVLPTLREHLEGIEIIQESAASFSSPIDHRYDRLIPAPPRSAPVPQ